MGVVAFVERLNLTCSKVGNPPIYDNAVFPWTKEVEARVARDPHRSSTACWCASRTCPAFTKFPPTSHHQPGSRLENFSARRYGFKVRRLNIKRCPETWRVCQKIPGLITVMFSILEPGKHLAGAIADAYNGVLPAASRPDRAGAARATGIRVDKESIAGRTRSRHLRRRYRARSWNRTPHTRGCCSSISGTASFSGNFSIGCC